MSNMNNKICSSFQVLKYAPNVKPFHPSGLNKMRAQRVDSNGDVQNISFSDIEEDSTCVSL